MKKNSLLRSLLIGLSFSILYSWGAMAQDQQRPDKPDKGYSNNLQNTIVPKDSYKEQPRIVGGNDGDIADYPFMVSIEVAGVGHFCGGSIIDGEWILTAAHCWDGTWSPSIDTNDPNNLTVRAGFTALSSSQGQFRAVEEIILHPGWTPGGSASQGEDIALLKLATPLDFTDPNVETVSYATVLDAEAGIQEPGTLTTIMGWGALVFQGGGPDILQVAQVPVVSNEVAMVGVRL